MTITLLNRKRKAVVEFMSAEESFSVTIKINFKENKIHSLLYSQKET